jgi:hypothetical protein
MPDNNQNKIAQLERSLKQLQDQYSKLKLDYEKHQHDHSYGTATLRKSIKLDKDQWLQVGYAGFGSDKNAGGQYQSAMSVGPDDPRTGFVTKANLAQIDILYSPTSFAGLMGRYGVLVSANESTSLSISSAGNTVTIAGYNFATNELAGAAINIYNSSGTMIANNLIASNTSTVITITGTWGATASGCTFDIYKPMYSGSAQYIWQRYYAQEGTDGGMRFGMGLTAGGKNGLLYMDSAGDLYWRDKGGASIKLNVTVDVSSFITASEAENIAQGVMDTHESTYDHSSL